MKVARVSTSLMASAERAVLPSLRQQPSERSRFDEAALSACEGCLREHAQERASAATASSREHASAQEAAKRRQSQLDAVRRRADQAEREFREVVHELKAGRAAVSEAESAQRRHRESLRALAREAAAKSAELRSLERLLASFRSLTSDGSADAA